MGGGIFSGRIRSRLCEFRGELRKEAERAEVYRRVSLGGRNFDEGDAETRNE
jgi:hypothetical protein